MGLELPLMHPMGLELPLRHPMGLELPLRHLMGLGHSVDVKTSYSTKNN